MKQKQAQKDVLPVQSVSEVRDDKLEESKDHSVSKVIQNSQHSPFKSPLNNLNIKKRDSKQFEKSNDINELSQSNKASAQFQRPSPVPSETSSISSFCAPADQIRVSMVHNSQKHTLEETPDEISELRRQVASNIKSSVGLSVTEGDFQLFYLDSDNERCIVESQDDLEVAYQLARDATPSHLKLMVVIERGIIQAKETHGVDYLDDRDTAEANTDEIDSSTDDEHESFSFIEYSSFKDRIIREGYSYMSTGKCRLHHVQNRPMKVYY